MTIRGLADERAVPMPGCADVVVRCLLSLHVVLVPSLAAQRRLSHPLPQGELVVVPSEFVWGLPRVARSMGQNAAPA
jgi:hypothetical protein